MKREGLTELTVTVSSAQVHEIARQVAVVVVAFVTVDARNIYAEFPL